jgi:RNA polymerase sigma-70 factor (ECF subfamily)
MNESLNITQHQMEEIELLDKAQSGDKGALSRLVNNYEKTVYNFAFKICRDPEKAENTMQETFLSMIKSLNQFDGKSKLSTWLYRIVMNHCLMELRKKKHDFISLDDDESDIPEDKLIPDWSSVPSDITENAELKRILDEAISKLSVDYRVVFILRDVNGLSTEETAKITDLSVPAVKSRLHRARAFLRNEISKVVEK